MNKIPTHLKIGPKQFSVVTYSNLIENTETCKTGGFFYAYRDSWLDFAIKNKYYEEYILWKSGNGYYYDSSTSLSSVKIDPARYFNAKNLIDSERVFHNKILFVEDIKDANRFQEVFGIGIIKKGDCEIDWSVVRKCFGGFETRLYNDLPINLLQKHDISWLRWWYAASGVVWNFRLIDKIETLKSYKPPVVERVLEESSQDMEKDEYLITTDTPLLLLNEIFNPNGIEFYGYGSTVKSNNVYANYIKFHDSMQDKILIHDRLKDFTISLKEAREKYSAIYCRETRKGLLFDIDIIKSVSVDIF